MGVYFPGEITIGAPIPGPLMPELTKQLERAGLLTGGTDLRKYLDKGRLSFSDSEASYGCFRSLEDFLQAHDIEFDRWSDGTYEYDPEMVTFRKGGKPRSWPTDRDGQRVVRVSEVDKLLKQRGIKEARRQFRKLLDPVIPPLKKITPEGLLLQADASTSSARPSIISRRRRAPGESERK